MPKIASDYQENIQIVIRSHLPIQKKQRILQSLSEQLDVLCDHTLVPDLTDKERSALDALNIRIKKSVHKLSSNL